MLAFAGRAFLNDRIVGRGSSTLRRPQRQLAGKRAAEFFSSPPSTPDQIPSSERKSMGGARKNGHWFAPNSQLAAGCPPPIGCTRALCPPQRALKFAPGVQQFRGEPCPPPRSPRDGALGLKTRPVRGSPAAPWSGGCRVTRRLPHANGDRAQGARLMGGGIKSVEQSSLTLVTWGNGSVFRMNP